ncbi:lipopolysaccharide assembly protein LapB [Halalkalibacter sp. APA_J-10(15)]|uniref:tetratricopeptide repeat protein n=1 Tax=Halalkalibacter sp. APA_J-10(15) TaxID=2933805 RepID=UPI001FF505D3|nr:hypothetical protein [Halalkalibacter sp. APA_J-10(15)]MCK0469871.1 hypothetical protein [Halalkalibacter sp. APA_J-10(15)]
MEDSFYEKVRLIKLYINNGEIERSKDLAEEAIRDEPESYVGYSLMAYHYHCLNEFEEVLKWTDETLNRAPENEHALEVVLRFYPKLPENAQKCKEIAETGLRLNPNNHTFLFHYAIVILFEDQEKGLELLNETIRLQPENDFYLGTYTNILFQLGRNKEAEKYEQLALQANPENSNNLLDFAWYAFQLKKYKKAQALIAEAIRIEPEDRNIRRYYQIIYPSKHPFVRLRFDFNSILKKPLIRISTWIWTLFKQKPPFWTVFLSVLFLSIIGLYFLLGRNIFIITMSIYLSFIFISYRISRSLLKETGITDDEERSLKKETKTTQREAIKEMKQSLPIKHDPYPEQSSLSPDELQAKLTELWDSDNITEIKENTRYIESKPTAETRNRNNQSTTTAIDWSERYQELKEYSKWPVYVMISGLILSLLFRFGPHILENESSHQPVSSEVQESIIEFQQTQAEEDDDEKDDTVADQTETIQHFIKSIIEQNVAEEMPELVSSSVLSMIEDNPDHALFDQLENSEIKESFFPHRGLSIGYFYLEDVDGNATAFIEVFSENIMNIYAKGWSKTEEDIEKYYELLEYVK